MLPLLIALSSNSDVARRPVVAEVQGAVAATPEGFAGTRAAIEAGLPGFTPYTERRIGIGSATEGFSSDAYVSLGSRAYTPRLERLDDIELYVDGEIRIGMASSSGASCGYCFGPSLPDYADAGIGVGAQRRYAEIAGVEDVVVSGEIGQSVLASYGMVSVGRTF